MLLFPLVSPLLIVSPGRECIATATAVFSASVIVLAFVIGSVSIISHWL